MKYTFHIFLNEQSTTNTYGAFRIKNFVEVLEEPEIMQVILELSEFVSSLDEWVSCLEEDRHFSGKTDYDLKEILSLITLVTITSIWLNVARSNE